MTLEAWVGLGIFLVTYLVIATEWLHKTVAAMAGGVAMVLLGIVTQEQAFEEIDFNVIFLLAGMMILAAIIRKTGVFGWLAVRSARFAGGDPYRILVVLSVITAGASAFLDNVTTVVLVGPITLFLAARMGLNPMPFIIAEVLASNIGGTSTLIGDPPNILIGSAADIDFATFAANMGPLALIILVLFLVAARWLFRNHLQVDPELRDSLLALDEREMIADPRLLRTSLAVLGLTLVGFLLHGALHLEPATIALAGAVLLMVVARQDPHEVLGQVEWPTLFFFIGLFMVVAGVIEIGLIQAVANALIEITGGALTAGAFVILWISAILSAFVDNIPYTATMIPVVEQMSEPHGGSQALWWALAAGADLGGNATIIGASANVILANMAEREGHPITFGTFFRYAAPVTFGSIVVSMAYIWVRYLA
ncbi:MAG TPA: ArsB/NhaD family transporter [candidate division Zixibacteria bacterium]|nr:ArsB/NhaD family transporter [candidate division Zixibacteria bacterium]